MSRDYRLYLQDMVERADRALDHARGMTFAEFIADSRAQDAAVLNLIILGEAAKRIPVEVRDRASGVAWQQVMRTRDRLVHGYDTTNFEVVWRVLTVELMLLRDRVAALIVALDAESPPPT